MDSIVYSEAIKYYHDKDCGGRDFMEDYLDTQVEYGNITSKEARDIVNKILSEC